MAGSTVRIKYLGHAQRTPVHNCTPTRSSLAPKCRKPQTSYCFASGCEFYASSMTPRLICCTLANKLIWSFVSRSRHQQLHQPLVLGPPSLQSSRNIAVRSYSCTVHAFFIVHLFHTHRYKVEMHFEPPTESWGCCVQLPNMCYTIRLRC